MSILDYCDKSLFNVPGWTLGFYSESVVSIPFLSATWMTSPQQKKQNEGLNPGESPSGTPPQWYQRKCIFSFIFFKFPVKYQIQERQEWLMRVITTEFSSLHLCSLTFSRPLRTLFSFCLWPVLDERLMTSIRGQRLLISFQISMNSHLKVIFIYIKNFLFFF